MSILHKLKVVYIFTIAVIAVANPIAAFITWLIVEEKLNKGK